MRAMSGRRTVPPVGTVHYRGTAVGEGMPHLALNLPVAVLVRVAAEAGPLGDALGGDGRRVGPQPELV